MTSRSPDIFNLNSDCKNEDNRGENCDSADRRGHFATRSELSYQNNGLSATAVVREQRVEDFRTGWFDDVRVMDTEALEVSMMRVGLIDWFWVA